MTGKSRTVGEDVVTNNRADGVTHVVGLFCYRCSRLHPTKRSRKFFRNQPRGCPKTLTRSQMTGFNHPSDKSHTRSHQRRCTVYGESHESYAAEQSNPVWAGSKCDPHPSRRPTPRDDPPLATTHPSRRPTPRDASDATQRKRPARWLRQQSAASISASTRLRSPRYPPKHGG